MEWYTRLNQLAELFLSPLPDSFVQFKELAKCFTSCCSFVAPSAGNEGYKWGIWRWEVTKDTTGNTFYLKLAWIPFVD